MKALENNYKSSGSKIYNVGIYLRLSREDDENNAVSQSITNQKDFLTTYAIENEFNIIDYYIDDGYSGTTFDRPDFNRLIEDIEKGRINTVITKDLSRLGRDYIMTGHYIEKYFPSKNVRYIAVNDGVDTYVENSNDMTPFKSVINDMYAKDISKKIRTAITTKKLKGEFIGSIAPYGYKKDETNKNKLIIDEEQACIVRRIFKMFINNPSMMGISKQLTNEKIPTPSALKKLTATQKGIYKGLWNDVIIRRILTNPTYIGNLTQNRSKKVSYKVHKQHSIPIENWIIIPNTHEGIISEKDFNTVQSLMSKRNYIKPEKKEHLLSGLVFCGDCKKAMTFSTEKRNPKRVYLVCSTRKKYGKLSICPPRSIREDYLQNQVIEKIKEIAKKYVDKDLVIENSNTKNQYTEYVNNLRKEKVAINKQLEEIKTLIMNLYKDKVKNIISEQDFIELSKEFNNQREALTQRFNNIDGQIEQTHENKSNMVHIEKYLSDFLQFENIDRLTLITLISRIYVLENKKLFIKFNFFEP